MTKGTASQRGGKIVHQRCRRCGKHSYHRQAGKCSSCGFGDTARWRSYNWAKQKY
ncbi:MAG: 50S ribosomal protein L37e [Thermoplasmata archaeon]|nr:50S ribosomal protein L37e [Thermoplasmata archaeon]